MSLNFELLFESLPESYLVLNVDAPTFTVAAASECFFISSKKTRAQLLNRPLNSVLPGCDCLSESLHEVLDLKKPKIYRSEKFFEAPDELWDVTHFPIMENDGVKYIVQHFRDVRGQKTSFADFTLGKMASQITDKLPIGLTYVNADEKYMYCNSTYASWRGLSKGNILGKYLKDFLDEENYFLAKKVIESCLAGNEHKSEVVINLNGTPHTIQALNIPDKDENGRVRGFTTLAVDISDHRELEQSLLDAKENAECANRAKSEFLANMSHEIRTPLGAVLGFADLIANTDVTPEEKRSFTSAIQRNGELLTNIISDILDLSKVEVGKLNVERKETMLKEVLNDVMTILGKPAHEKQVALVLSFDNSVPWLITTDHLRLRQILLNVIGNAIKFTERGTVKLDIKLTNGADGKRLLNFNIADSGKGISTEQAKKLFRPFSQGDSSIVRKFGGTGLGLVLSRHLSQLLGGDLVLTESTPGRGSVFTVTIDPSPYRTEERTTEPPVEKKALSDVTDIRLDGSRVLLVDDSEDNQYFISKILKIAGAEVDVAGNGLDAIEKARTGDYQICLMDIQMPVMDGYEAAYEMKKMRCKFPIIALTAHALKEVRQLCIDSGFSDYISKPINRNELIEHISHLIRK